MSPVGLLLQGPLYDLGPGKSTLELLRSIASAPSRARFVVVLATWTSERSEVLALLEPLVDRLVVTQQPERAGSGNRNLQASGVNAGLAALADLGVQHAVKTRTDIMLDERFLRLALEHERRRDGRVLVTNLFTRWEPFHVSDFVVVGTLHQLRAWFEPEAVYYEDAFSPEVQFARCYVRNTGLPYTMRLQDYLAFLAERIDLVDFDDAGLTWFKRNPPIRSHWYARALPALGDRDAGPLLGRMVTSRAHRWLRRTPVPWPILAYGLRTLDPLAEAALSLLPEPLHIRARSPFHRYYLAHGVPEHDRPIERPLADEPEPILTTVKEPA